MLSCSEGIALQSISDRALYTVTVESLQAEDSQQMASASNCPPHSLLQVCQAGVLSAHLALAIGDPGLLISSHQFHVSRMRCESAVLNIQYMSQGALIDSALRLPRPSSLHTAVSEEQSIESQWANWVTIEMHRRLGQESELTLRSMADIRSLQTSV